MESYPEDLLVGVFPLVFAVNAIYDPNNPNNDEIGNDPTSGGTSSTTTGSGAASASAAGGGGSAGAAAGDSSGNETPASPKHTRSDFDRFLDALHGSLVADENDETNDNNITAQLEFPPIMGPTETPSSSRNVSLFRPDDDEMDESTDEDLLMIDADADDDYSSTIPGSSRSTTSGGRRVSSGANAMRLYAGFGLTRRSMATGVGAHSHSSTNTSYAKALQQGQGFFQRARIVSISTKHGFPPSKDPDGTKSIVFQLKQARSSIQKAREIFTARPIQGILPAGWLEKHVYALPSVVLVVVKLSKSNQSEQDSQLLKTVESLQYSLVPKRTCKIHVVGLVDDDIGVSHAQQWSLDISRQIVDSHANPNHHHSGSGSGSGSTNNPTHQHHQGESSHQITLLRAGKDLRSGTDGFPTSLALKRLHRSVRDASLMYYLGQTRRTKEKLAKLSEGGKKRISGARVRVQPPKELLPLAIRYCFKIAMYYEFQLKFEKSLKFMAEAYRHVRTYYHHLIRLSTRGSDLSDDEDDRVYTDSAGVVDRSKAISTGVSISTGDTEDMEVSIATELTTTTMQGSTDVNAQWSSGVPPPPSDMAHQCLAVADWLNFKLLQAGFGSHTEGGLLAADGQWRQHSRVFCARRFLGGHPIMSEEWYFWCHVAHQRLVMSQLVERHPPKALGDLGNEYDEVLLRCAPWRAYEAAAEAYLKAGVGVEEALAKKNLETSGEKDDARAPFVGGLDKDGLAPVLEKESKIDHKGKALELVLRAISMFEHEWGKEKLKDAEDQFPHRPWGRFGARLYFLAGGILLSKKSHAEATGHLENAAKYSTGWSGLEGAVRCLLAECYAKHAPATLGEAESSLRISSMVMDACFYAKMSPANLGRALSSCSAVVKTPSILWSCECFDEFDTRLPFSFSITFPKMTHATAGDTVMACVLIRSNLDYAVTLESIMLLSMAGQIKVPFSDFSVGSSSPVVIASRQELAFTTPITLPKNIEDIAVDEHTDAKSKANSYTKSARPRTAAITSAAGGRIVSEELFPKKARNSNAQWSLNFLGGKPMRCDGIRLVLRPIDGEGTSLAPEKPVELSIEKKKKAKTAANIKRTPFEEDNYIASAWCRPFHMPLPSGPRCLRVLGPMSDMEITNMSQSVSDGNAIEGTVNRICLKLQAGAEEMCSDIKYKIKCSTTLVTIDGTTKNLSADKSTAENEIYMKGADVRAPVIVANAAQMDNAPTQLDYGFTLPKGWELVGSGQESSVEMTPKAASLAGGESTYLCFELYRPSDVSAGNVTGVEEPMPRTNICQSHFEVTVTYKQERQDGHGDSGQKEEMRGEKRISENVSQKFSGSVVWAAPIAVSYNCQTRNPIPCGSRHPSNLTDDARPSDTSIFTNIPMVDGDRITICSTLQSNEKVNDLDVEIAEVRFETSDELPCRLAVTSENEADRPGSLYRASKDDPSRWLKKNSKFSFVYSVHAEMINKKRSATFPLGNISVDWLPKQIDLPEEAKAALGPEIEAHGPLVLSTPISMKFKGPLCYIEKALFKTTFECHPPIPKVSIPFNVNYSITNETDTHQRLAVALGGQPGSGQKSQDILICGLLAGDLRLAPFETKLLSYTAIATKPGMATLPIVSVSSTRFNAWVVNEGGEKARALCILP